VNEHVRRVAGWLPAVVLVPVALVTGAVVTAEDDELDQVRAVHPLDVGTTWVYAVSDHGSPSGTRTRQVTGKAPVDLETLDGVAISTHYTDYPGVGETSQLIYVGATDGRLVQYGLVSGLQASFLEPPAPLYEYPVGDGQGWSYDGKLGDADVRLDVEVLGPEDVDVAGRTFAECTHYRTTQLVSTADAPGDEEVIEEWTCPDVGPVRTRDVIEARDVDVTEELVSFHGPHGSWDAVPPDPVTALTSPATVGSTAGLDPSRDNHVAEGDPQQRLLWSDLRSEAISFGAVGDGRVMVMGEGDGQVSAVDVTSGEVAWRVRLRGPIATTPAIADDLVLVADADKNLWALDLADGHARWVYRFGDVVAASPAVATDSVVVASDDNRLTSLALADGAPRWRTSLSAPVTAAPALSGDLVVVADRTGSVTAHDLGSGDVVWSQELEDTAAAGPSVGEETVVVADAAGTVVAFDLADGRSRWQASSHYYPSGGFAVGGGVAVVGASDRRLMAFDLRSGDVAWSVPHRRFRAAPVLVGDEVVTVTRDGTIQVRTSGDGTLARDWALPPSGESRRDVSADIGVVGDALVVTATLFGPGLKSGSWAYSLEADRAPAEDGVAFRVAKWTLPLPLEAPAVLAGQTLFATTFDGTLHRVPPDGPATAVFGTNAQLVPGVAADRDLVVAQRDNEFVGLDPDGRELWTAPAVDPFPGSIPAIAGDTVFLPLRGVGLVAVDRQGAQRWFTPIRDSGGTTTPLPLPGGDVVYGTGTIARYDGTTGDRLWSVPDAALFAPTAYDRDRVFADLVREEQPAGLAAIDAATGAIRWSRPNDAQHVLLGPAAGDGVVVYADTTGLLTGLDGASGEELWTHQVETSLAGVPVIAGGRVFLVEQGRQEDLNQRASRVSAYDLRSGRFLGSYEPLDSSNSTRPVVGTTPRGDLLVPATGSDGIWVLRLTPQDGPS
jgi:outer membrane protein assembly factor BamB